MSCPVSFLILCAAPWRSGWAPFSLSLVSCSLLVFVPSVCYRSGWTSLGLSLSLPSPSSLSLLLLLHNQANFPGHSLQTKPPPTPTVPRRKPASRTRDSSLLLWTSALAGHRRASGLTIPHLSIVAAPLTHPGHTSWSTCWLSFNLSLICGTGGNNLWVLRNLGR